MRNDSWRFERKASAVKVLLVRPGLLSSYLQRGRGREKQRNFPLPYCELTFMIWAKADWCGRRALAAVPIAKINHRTPGRPNSLSEFISYAPSSMTKVQAASFSWFLLGSAPRPMYHEVCWVMQSTSQFIDSTAVKALLTPAGFGAIMLVALIGFILAYPGVVCASRVSSCSRRHV